MDSNERESIERELQRETSFQKRQQLMKCLWHLTKNGTSRPNPTTTVAKNDDDKTAKAVQGRSV